MKSLPSAVLSVGRADPDDPPLVVERQPRDLLLRLDHPLGKEETDGQRLQIAGGAEDRDELLAVEHDRQGKLAGRPFRPDPAPLAVDMQRFDALPVFHVRASLQRPTFSIASMHRRARAAIASGTSIGCVHVLERPEDLLQGRLLHVRADDGLRDRMEDLVRDSPSSGGG